MSLLCFLLRSIAFILLIDSLDKVILENLKLRESKPAHRLCLFISRRFQIPTGRDELSSFFEIIAFSGSFGNLYTLQIQHRSDPLAHRQQGGPAADRFNICTTASLRPPSQLL